jgi:transposase
VEMVHTMKSEQDASRRQRRQHERAFKEELVRQSLVPGASVSAIALDNGINANMLFKWRREHLRAASPRTSATVLLPVEVAPAAEALAMPSATTPLLPTAPAKPSPRGGVIELEVAGVQLRLRGPVDEASLCSVSARAAPDAMIGPHAGTRVWLAAGVTDMRCGIDSLAAKVHTVLAVGPLRRPRVRVPRTPRRPHQAAVERRRRHVPADQAARTRPLHLAAGRQRQRHAQRGPALDAAGGHRLAPPGAHLAATRSGLSSVQARCHHVDSACPVVRWSALGHSHAP